MNDKPEIVLFGIIFGFAVVVPAGLLYINTSFLQFDSLGETLAFVLPVLWFSLIVVGFMGLGGWLQIPTDILLGAGVLGTIFGFLIFAGMVGWGYVMFAIAALALLAVMVGSWGAYEWNRQRGDTNEPPVGTWRQVFAIFAAAIGFIPVLLVVV